VRVIDEFVANVAELYQLADCYVFPVPPTHWSAEAHWSIDAPLSILEAMACDLPVVSTRWEGLTRLFPGAPGLRIVDTPDDIAGAVADCRGLERPGTRALVADYGWPAVAAETVEVIDAALELSPSTRGGGRTA
jgi:glycosyltransferase involved in cell wall biosynthesis